MAAAAAGTAAMLTLSACGGDGEGLAGWAQDASEEPKDDDAGTDDEPASQDITQQSAEEISEAAADALLAVDSIRITGTGDSEDGFLELDIHLDREGTCSGVVGFQGQGSFEILRKDDDVWMKPDAEFWRTNIGGADGEAAAAQLDGMYMYGTVDHPDLAGAAEMCDLDDLLGELDATDTSETVTKGEESVHNDIPVIALLEEERNGDTATVLVATEGEPYPVHMAGTSDGETFDVDFSDFDVAVEVTAPPRHLILDIEELASSVGV